MEALETLRTALPDSARDIRLNIQSVLKDGALSEPQRWGVAVASAIAARNARLREAVLAAAATALVAAVVDDARSPATLRYAPGSG